jgi:hypothetical protein
MLTFLDYKVLREKTWEILQFLAMNPGSTLELIWCLALAYLVVSITLAKMHSLGGSGSGSIVIGLIVTAIGVFGIMEVAVLCDMLLLPLMDKEFRPFAYNASIVIAIFILLIPFTKTFFRAGYSSSLGAWLVAIILGTATVMGVGYYFDDKKERSATIESVREHTKEVQEMIQGQGKKQKEEPIPPAPQEP